MKIRKAFLKHIPLGLTILAAAGCVPASPDYCCVRQNNAIYDMCRLNNNIRLLRTELTLCDIVQIAVECNLDVQIQKMEEAVQCEKVFAEKLKALPELDINADFSNRNNNPAWYSRTVNPPPVPNPTGKENSRNTNPTPRGALASQSTSKFHRDFDFALAYNIIDFGLSFVRARQEKNRLCLLMQRNMRARQNLVLDVYRAYYRAIVAKQAVAQSEKLIGDLEARQEQLQQQVESQLVSEMKGLVNENRLIDMQVKLYAFENEYRSAMTELSALMGLPPGQRFTLVPMDVQDVNIADIDTADLEKSAFLYRPELMAQDMQYHVDSDEVKAIMIQMFPNARLFGGMYHDDDRFMFNHDWWSVGTNISWDLFRLPSQWRMEKAARFKKQVAWETRLSMSMGILTQVHLANINVQETGRQYKLATNLFKVKQRQLNVANVLEASGELSVDDVMVFEVEALFAEVNAVKAFANLQVALEQLANAIGRPMRYSGLPKHCIPTGLEQRCIFPDGEMVAPSVVQRQSTQLFTRNGKEQLKPTPIEVKEEEPYVKPYVREEEVEEVEETIPAPTPARVVERAAQKQQEDSKGFEFKQPYERAADKPKQRGNLPFYINTITSKDAEGKTRKERQQEAKKRYTRKTRKKRSFVGYNNPTEEIADNNQEWEENLQMEQQQESTSPAAPSPYIRDTIDSLEDNQEPNLDLEVSPPMEEMQQEAESLNLDGGFSSVESTESDEIADSSNLYDRQRAKRYETLQRDRNKFDEPVKQQVKKAKRSYYQDRGKPKSKKQLSEERKIELKMKASKEKQVGPVVSEEIALTEWEEKVEMIEQPGYVKPPELEPQPYQPKQGPKTKYYYYDDYVEHKQQKKRSSR